ncbi:metal-dependent hydrolase [Candidatus Nitrosacidococcus tergens]|uniref:Membrane-bound metal-dependent hydrolase n=1 Tax=Candidatus Nitrosacidococcus tergens TaxID=553981 RepID=A0A7G1Q7A7_9GAMM|nr:metal-dependent hydrolase [Candidatus Nitrosacidococcus tergens]CAB1274357.1 Membrane-bound metal-dependent hydrolase [Candidatus Nitrosacidococcus tergens]
MANFNTHITGAMIVSGIGITALMVTRTFPISTLTAYFILGVIGGILPDIDSKSSIAIRWIFNTLGITMGFFGVLYGNIIYSLSLLELILVWVGIFILIRYGLASLFTRLTIHRGLIHSIPMGIAITLTFVITSRYILSISILEAWFSGTFLLLGFITHLLLDELYSVDLRGIRLKRSFGTALSLGSLQAPIKTLLLYLFTGTMIYYAPPIDSFLHFIQDDRLHQLLIKKLLPLKI